VNADLRAPGDRYRVAIDVIGAAGGDQKSRCTVEQGVAFWDVGGPVRSEDGAVQAHSYMVVVDDLCSLVLVPGENGLTIRWVRLLNAAQATIRARVIAGSGAPDWLPPESEYQIFEGDAAAATAFEEQFIPLNGMAAERSWTQGATPLDLLAIAVGKSVARANAALARVQSEGGVALVSSVTVRVAVNQAEVARGRMLVSFARSGEGQTGQFVELVMTTVPGAAPEPDPDPAALCLPPGDTGTAAAAGGPTPAGRRSTTASAVFSSSQIAEAGQRVFGVNPQQPADGSTVRPGSGPPGPALAP
jgi:hypothetical protein